MSPPKPYISQMSQIGQAEKQDTAEDQPADEVLLRAAYTQASCITEQGVVQFSVFVTRVPPKLGGAVLVEPRCKHRGRRRGRDNSAVTRMLLGPSLSTKKKACIKLRNSVLENKPGCGLQGFHDNAVCRRPISETYLESSKLYGRIRSFQAMSRVSKELKIPNISDTLKDPDGLG